jgi:hypothetical protein
MRAQPGALTMRRWCRYVALAIVQRGRLRRHGGRGDGLGGRRGFNVRACIDAKEPGQPGRLPESAQVRPGRCRRVLRCKCRHGASTDPRRTT